MICCNVVVDEKSSPPTCVIGDFRSIEKDVKRRMRREAPKSTKEIQLRVPSSF